MEKDLNSLGYTKLREEGNQTYYGRDKFIYQVTPDKVRLLLKSTYEYIPDLDTGIAIRSSGSLLNDFNTLDTSFFDMKDRVSGMHIDLVQSILSISRFRGLSSSDISNTCNSKVGDLDNLIHIYELTNTMLVRVVSTVSGGTYIRFSLHHIVHGRLEFEINLKNNSQLLIMTADYLVDYTFKCISKDSTDLLLKLINALISDKNK